MSSPSDSISRAQTNPRKLYPSKSDLNFEETLLSATKELPVERRREGVKPKADIFDRSVIRLIIPANGAQDGVDPKVYSSHKNRLRSSSLSMVMILFPSALRKIVRSSDFLNTF